MMLLVLTIERYVSVCHPGFVRPVMGPPRWVFRIQYILFKQPFSYIRRRVTVVLIPLVTFIIYLPSVFRGEIIKCVLPDDGTAFYHQRDNDEFLETLFYSVLAYKAHTIFAFFFLIDTFS